METEKRAGLWVVVVATILAVAVARPYAGGWNDGSRLATVEALVDAGSLVIDDSIFVRVPPERSPYPARDHIIQKTGTLDKMLVRGHYYSDKPPVQALLLAGVYAAIQKVTGLTARENPGLFCWLMTVLSSGPAFVVSVWCVYRIGRTVGLSLEWSLGLAASLGLATAAPAYATHVNGHIALLAVTSAITLLMVVPGKPWRIALAVGFLAGFGYTQDLGVGPFLLVALGGWSLWRGGLVGAFLFVVAALPWLALHHAYNYSISGMIAPSNTNPEFFRFPGSPFGDDNLTGKWFPKGYGRQMLYSLDMLVGKKGLLTCNLPLYLAVAAIPGVLYRRGAERPAVVASLVWCAGAFAAYALTSSNYSGGSASIRWFVPMLAPGYLVLAVLMRDQPRFRGDFVLLSLWGVPLAFWMVLRGAWMLNMIPYVWPVLAAAMLTWLFYRRWESRRETRAVRAGIATADGSSEVVA